MSEKHAVLLVDDEPDILHSLVGLLRREFEVHTAESGSQALDIMAEHAIHVVMTDQRMPEMTGASLVREICQRHPDTTRILFTGYADIKSVIEAVNYGGLFRYVTKPWDPDDLVDLLREAAGEYEKARSERLLKEEIADFVAGGQRLASQMLESGVDANRADLEALRQSGERLGQLLAQTRTTAAGA